MKKEKQDMAAAKEAVEQQPQVQQLNMTVEMLQQLIASAVSAAVAEAKKPYIDPEAVARKEREREMVRQEEEQRLANKTARQENCPHVDAYENFAFVGQRNCLGQVVFLCSQCCKPFAPGDKDYNHFVRYIKGDRMGAARTN